MLGPTPSPHLRSALAFHDFLHVPGFALVTSLLLVAFPPPLGPVRRRVARLAFLLAFSVCLGILVELLQLVIHGEAIDRADIARDVAGGVSTVLVAASFWADVAGRSRWTLRVAALCIAVSFLGPTVVAVADEARAGRQFPVLADFSGALEFDRFEWSALSTTRRECAEGADQPCAAHIMLSPGEYAGFTLRFFPRDWRGYRRFAFSCRNLSAEPLPITIRIDDMRHNNAYDDRFNATYVLASGANEIRVPLTDVERAPRGRTLDMQRIRTVTVFAYRLRSPRTIIVQSLRLER